MSIPKPDPQDKQSIHFLIYEYVEYFVKIHRDVPQEVVRILTKDALPFWRERDARTITSREIIERLDAIVARGAPVMANRTAAIFSQIFTFGVRLHNPRRKQHGKNSTLTLRNGAYPRSMTKSDVRTSFL